MVHNFAHSVFKQNLFLDIWYYIFLIQTNACSFVFYLKLIEILTTFLLLLLIIPRVQRDPVNYSTQRSLFENTLTFGTKKM